MEESIAGLSARVEIMDCGRFGCFPEIENIGANEIN
jgi:hypothetical protein